MLGLRLIHVSKRGPSYMFTRYLAGLFVDLIRYHMYLKTFFQALTDLVVFSGRLIEILSLLIVLIMV